LVTEALPLIFIFSGLCSKDCGTSVKSVDFFRLEIYRNSYYGT
jgi:hypothetical protein